MGVGDTGATKHSTKHMQGGINSRPSTRRTRGIYGQAVKPSMVVDLPGTYCDKRGEEQFAVNLQNMDVIPENHYNLISITKLIDEGHQVTANKKDDIAVQKGGQLIKFVIRVKTQKGVLWWAYIKQPEPEGKVTARMSDNKVNNQLVKSAQKLTSAIKMHIEQAHEILGCSSKDATRRTAAGLDMLITRGAFKTCAPRVIAKVK